MTIDLSHVSTPTLLARGQYATIRGMHEDEKKRLSVLCGELQSIASQVLRHLQPHEDEPPAPVTEMLAYGRTTIDKIEAVAAKIDELAQQRAQLRPIAWGKSA